MKPSHEQPFKLSVNGDAINGRPALDILKERPGIDLRRIQQQARGTLGKLIGERNITLVEYLNLEHRFKDVILQANELVREFSNGILTYSELIDGLRPFSQANLQVASLIDPTSGLYFTAMTWDIFTYEKSAQNSANDSKDQLAEDLDSPLMDIWRETNPEGDIWSERALAIPKGSQRDTHFTQENMLTLHPLELDEELSRCVIRHGGNTVYVDIYVKDREDKERLSVSTYFVKMAGVLVCS